MTEPSFKALADAGDVLPFLRRHPWLKQTLENGFGLTQVNRILGEASRESAGDPLVFSEAALRLAGVSCVVDLAVPETGATLVVSNHPFGGADAIALFGECLRARSDVRIFGNRMLLNVPPLRESLLPLEIMSGDASQENGVAIRKAIRHLKSGGLVIVFPAGMVSFYQSNHRRVADAEWNPMVGALVRLGRPSVIPAAFLGRNSLLFQTLGLVSPVLRTAMLPREFVRLKGTTIRIVSDKVVTWQELESADNAKITVALRKRVDRLCGVE